MNFEGKQLVKHTNAGQIRTAGCTITRGLDSWIVSCAGTFVAECDTYAEAEAKAKAEGGKVRERVARMDAEAAERRAERQSEEAAEARRMGGSIHGFDD